MKVVLLAGGKGTRITEESEYRPKPMIEVGGMPILWHVMKEYSYYGFHEFIILEINQQRTYQAQMEPEYNADIVCYNWMEGY